MDSQKTRNGFTFVELLLCLTIISIVTQLIVFLIPILDYDDVHEELSIQQFFFFLRNDVLQSRQVNIVNEKLVFTQSSGTKIMVEQYGNLIRRQQDGVGHEIYLRNILSVTFSKLNYGIHVKVVSQEGNVYEKTIQTFGK